MFLERQPLHKTVNLFCGAVDLESQPPNRTVNYLIDKFGEYRGRVGAALLQSVAPFACEPRFYPIECFHQLTLET